MANHPSAEKRNRQNKKRRNRNTMVRSQVHRSERKLITSIEGKDSVAIGEALRRTVSTVMTARSKGVIHKNTASRKISRLSRRAQKAIAR